MTTTLDPSSLPDPREPSAAPFTHRSAAAGTAAAAGPPHVPGFDLGEEVGRGGMGVVYRARDLALSRDVAVKLLRDRFPAGGSAGRRFVQEAHVTAQLQHPGVPPVYQVGTLPDGRPFLAMKLIKGRTLDDLLKDRVREGEAPAEPPSAPDPRLGGSLALPGINLVAVFEQVCQAVGYAHAHGVVHRDLKPQNVMVGAFNEVQVMDWGLAKVLASRERQRPELPDDEDDLTAPGTAILSAREEDDATRAGDILGTPAFMPPEQAIGAVDQVDARSDVFGLGAILCVILTGRPPYVGADRESTRQLSARAKLDGAFTRLVGCGADPGLVALCRRCLAAEKGDRPRDAGEVAAAVGRLRADAEDRARRAEVDRARAEVRAAEARRRRRVQAALAAAVLLLAAGGGAFAWWEDNRAGARRVEEAVAEARARQAVESAIALAADLREKFRFAQARAALDHAAGTIPPGAPSDIRDRLDRARDDLELVRELDTIRASRVTNPNWRPYPELTAEYRAVFRGRGVDPAEDDPVVTAGRVAASPVRHHLVVALDDWAWLESNPETRGRLLAATRRADPDPWLDRVRDPAAWDDEAVMNRLAAEIDAAAPPPHHVVLICQVVGKTWARGADLLEAAAARHPDDFWVQFEAGYYWAVKDPQPARAMQHLQAALALRPDNPNAMMLMRGLLRKAGDTAGADRWLRAAAGVSGTDARRLVLLGRTLREEGDPDRETEFYRRAIADFPQSADGYNGMGIALAAKGDLDGAIAYYREGIRVDPTNARPFNNLGYALLNKGDLAGSEAALREAVRLDPRLTVALLNLGKLLHRKGDLDGAAAAVRGAIRLDPKGKSPRYRLSELLSAQGDRAGVVECFRDAVRHNPNAAWAHIELGVALANAGDPAGAEACYREAIKLDPKDPDGPNNLAWLLAVGPDGFRDGREAVRLATRACELTGFADANDLDTLAAAHAEAGDFGKAVEVQNRALALPGAEEQYGAEFHERLGLYERGRPYRNPAFVPRPVAPPPREVTR